MHSHSQRDTTVNPHQLCSVCEEVAKTYTPDPTWSREALWKSELARLEPYWPSAETQLRRHAPRATDIELFWITREPVLYHKGWSNVRSSSASGCHLCSLFVHTRDAWEGSVEPDVDKRQLYLVPDRLPKWTEDHDDRRNEISLCLFISPVWNLDEFIERLVSRVELFQRPRGQGVTGSTLHWIATAPSEGDLKWRRSTGSDQDLRNIKSWLQNCVDKHAYCGQRLFSQRPTRLLDLKPDCTSGDIRVVLSADIGPQPYATLSYSWGTSTTITLTRATYDEFLLRIEIAKLPKTIVDAIEICRRLSLRYLWVDALCIIQGDKDDFAKEISRMGSIYAGSHVTIAAADSRDSGSGCFRDRLPLQQEPCRVWEDDKDWIWFATNWNPCHEEQNALDSRSWVYQERLMSPRTIHFCRNDVMWECREQRLCERCSIYGSNFNMPPTSNRPDRKNIFKMLSGDNGKPDSVTEFQRVWSSMLHEYSQTILSNDDDRLSALAGIAQIPQQLLDQGASFGIWHSFFADDILWYALKEWQVRDDPCGYNELHQKMNVPSWSWIGMKDIVVSLAERRTFSLADANTIYCAEFCGLPAVTPFESITAITKSVSQPPTLRLRGRLTECRPIPMKYAPNSFGNFWRWVLVPARMQLSSWMREYEASLWEAWRAEKECTIPHPPPFEAYAIFKNEYHPDVEREHSQTVFCCHIKRVFCNSPARPSLLDIGLVLERIEPYKNGFHRVGAFKEDTMPFHVKDVGLEHPELDKIPVNSQEWIRVLGQQMLICSGDESLEDIEIF